MKLLKNEIKVRFMGEEYEFDECPYYAANEPYAPTDPCLSCNRVIIFKVTNPFYRLCWRAIKKHCEFKYEDIRE